MLRARRQLAWLLALAVLLAAQHYGYLRRQFFDVLEHRRPELEASHAAAMNGLDRDAIDGIADRLSRFKPAKSSR